jgi:hypothetical protein
MLVHIFVYLQLLDLLTTLVGFKLGAAEASPFIRVLMHAGPALGVALSKLVAFAIGGVCVHNRKLRLIRLANVWYGGVFVWNMAILAAAARPGM